MRQPIRLITEDMRIERIAHDYLDGYSTYCRLIEHYFPALDYGSEKAIRIFTKIDELLYEEIA